MVPFWSAVPALAAERYACFVKDVTAETVAHQSAAAQKTTKNESLCDVDLFPLFNYLQKYSTFHGRNTPISPGKLQAPDKWHMIISTLCDKRKAEAARAPLLLSGAELRAHTPTHETPHRRSGALAASRPSHEASFIPHPEASRAGEAARAPLHAPHARNPSQEPSSAHTTPHTRRPSQEKRRPRRFRFAKRSLEMITCLQSAPAKTERRGAGGRPSGTGAAGAAMRGAGRRRRYSEPSIRTPKRG